MTLIPGQFNEYTLEGYEGWLWWGGLFIPKDVDQRTNAAAAFFAPPAGRASIQAVAKGDNGFAPIIDPDVTISEIEYTDPTPVSSTWTTTDPGNETTPPTIKETRVVRKGPQGDPAAFNLVDADDLTGASGAGYMVVRNSGDTGFVYAPQKVAGTYWPAAVTAASNTAGPVTLAQTEAMPAFPFDVRLEAYGQAIVTGAASDVKVNLVARINNATTGQICGQGKGVAGTAPPRNDVIPGPPTGSSSSTYGKITAGTSGTVVYLRAERVGGSAAFSIDDDDVTFYVKVIPLP